MADDFPTRSLPPNPNLETLVQSTDSIQQSADLPVALAGYEIEGEKSFKSVTGPITTPAFSSDNKYLLAVELIPNQSINLLLWEVDKDGPPRRIVELAQTKITTIFELLFEDTRAVLLPVGWPGIGHLMARLCT